MKVSELLEAATRGLPSRDLGDFSAPIAPAMARKMLLNLGSLVTGVRGLIFSYDKERKQPVVKTYEITGDAYEDDRRRAAALDVGKPTPLRWSRFLSNYLPLALGSPGPVHLVQAVVAMGGHGLLSRLDVERLCRMVYEHRIMLTMEDEARRLESMLFGTVADPDLPMDTPQNMRVNAPTAATRTVDKLVELFSHYVTHDPGLGAILINKPPNRDFCAPAYLTTDGLTKEQVVGAARHAIEMLLYCTVAAKQSVYRTSATHLPVMTLLRALPGAKKGVAKILDTVIPVMSETLSEACTEAARPTNLRFYKGEAIPAQLAGMNGGPLHSCMTNGCADQICRLYAENPDKVRLLVLDDPHRPARALVWRTDEGRIFLDRIYPSNRNDEGYIKLLALARRKGWVAREYPGYPEYSEGINPIESGEELSVTVERPSNDQYPYMDTFYAAYEVGVGRLRLQCTHEHDADMLLCCTGGDYMPGGPSCDGCGDHIGEDDLHHVNGENLCEYCLNDNYHWVERIYEYVRRDDSVLAWNDEYERAEDCVELASGEWAHAEDTVTDYRGEYILEQDAATITHGPYEGQYIEEGEAETGTYADEDYVIPDGEDIESYITVTSDEEETEEETA